MMPNNDEVCTPPQTENDDVAAETCTVPAPKIVSMTPQEIDALPAIQSQYCDATLGETLSSYRQKAAERPTRTFDPYGRSADA